MKFFTKSFLWLTLVFAGISNFASASASFEENLRASVSKDVFEVTLANANDRIAFWQQLSPPYALLVNKTILLESIEEGNYPNSDLIAGLLHFEWIHQLTDEEINTYGTILIDELKNANSKKPFWRW